MQVSGSEMALWASSLILFSTFHALTGQIPDSSHIFPHDRAEKYSSHWYDRGAEDIKSALNLRSKETVARNVILFIGDGMSVTTLTAARIYKGQRHGRAGEGGSLFFETFPYASLVKTFNVDRQVPDSAATATAFLTGVKANYETLGVNAHVKALDTNCSLVKENSVPSIMKWAVDAGKHAGVVTTTRITHATPAATYSHSAFRYWENDAQLPKEVDSACKDIARQLIEDEPGRSLRVILGGGRKNFLPNSFVDPASNENGARNDENLIEKWLNARKAEGLQSHQYKWINSTKGLQDVHLDRIEYLFGLFNYNHMQFEAERDRSPDGEPSLTEMTTTAIKILSKSKNGFVLLVEGGRIDHAHHLNLAGMALSETVSLDETIEAAMKLVDLDETLVVVTADHAHTLTMNGYPERGQHVLGFSNENDTSGKRFETLLYGNGPGHTEPRTVPADPTKLRYAHYSAIHLEESNHDGTDVALYSSGPFAHLFQGLVDQTFIAHVMSFASCLGNYNMSSHCGLASSAGLSLIPSSFLLLVTLAIAIRTL